VLSREAEGLYGLNKKNNLNPQLAADQEGKVHVIWGNGAKIIHRLRIKEFWSPAPTQLAKEAMPWFGAPTCTLDSDNSLYCAWIEKGKTVYRKYSSARNSWDISQQLPPLFIEGFHSAPVLGPAWSGPAYKTREGFDLLYIERTTIESTDFHFKLYTNASFAAQFLPPSITSVVQTGGKLSVSWQAAKEQSACRVIVGSAFPLVTPYSYDSGILNEELAQHLTKAFAFKGNDLYIQVKTADRQGNWSAWSAPYHYELASAISENGPQLTLKGLEENSLYLYSPSADILYFGNGLDSPKAFTIFGTALAKGSGIKQISFSRYGENTPPPIVDPESANWEVQYSINSSDHPGEIIITATDYNGNTSRAVVKVWKDATPPLPPTWVRINPDREGHDIFQGKKYNKNKVYVFWKDGTDEESGLRYHVMGTAKQWWKDSVHRSGDPEIGQEGPNTFYVYAVDNVGNVSAPGTDTVFVDTVAPFPPELISRVTSTNMIWGIKSPDTVEVLVDGLTSRWS